MDETQPVEPADLDGSALSEPVRLLLRAFVRGEMVDRGGPDPLRPGADPADWGPDAQVRAAVIARLLSGSVPAKPGYTAKVRLAGARITGRLDLNGARIGAELLLARCWVDDDWDLTDAKARAIEAPKCRLRSINAGQLEVDGALDLSGSSIVSLVVPGMLARGLIDLSDAELDNPGGVALNAENLVASQKISCVRMTANGEVVLSGAHVGGALILDGATLCNPGRRALAGHRLTVAHSH